MFSGGTEATISVDWMSFDDLGLWPEGMKQNREKEGSIS